jgi:glycosyltransferase involved in cell wall biosynthesis
MRRWGVDVEVWSELVPVSPYPIDVVVHRGSFAEAVAASRPDIVHFHWLNFALQNAADLAEMNIPVTVRSHGFEFTPQVLDQILASGAIRTVAAFPHQLPEARERCIPLASAFDTSVVSPSRAKDRRLVIRTAAALASKDLRLFFEVAKRLPEFHFVLAVVTCANREAYVDELRSLSEEPGARVELLVDVPHDELISQLQSAAIYLHTCCIPGESNATPIGMPISIAEAMATGAYVLVRDVPALINYVGEGGASYRDEDDAVRLIRATETWSDEDWQRAWMRSVDRAYTHHADEIVLRPLLENWCELAEEARQKSDSSVRAVAL